MDDFSNGRDWALLLVATAGGSMLFLASGIGPLQGVRPVAILVALMLLFGGFQTLRKRRQTDER